MANINVEELWFNTINPPTVCRGGGNGPLHPSQLYAIKKYVKPGMSFLDYGAGSATTYEALKLAGIDVDYLGVDVIPRFTKWCQENFPEGKFAVNPTLHKIDQPDKSFDVVYSRHVVDHMRSFEEAMDEHCRVSKNLVIVVFWVPMSAHDEHEIKNIIDHNGEPNQTLYPNEYTNSYSRKKVMEWIERRKDFELLELSEEVGKEVRGLDWVLVLRRKNV